MANHNNHQSGHKAHHQHKKVSSSHGQPLPPPPHRDKQHHHHNHPPPPPPPKTTHKPTPSTTSSLPGSSTANPLIIDDDTTEDESDDLPGRRRPTTTSTTSSSKLVVEDVCLVCRGECHCGGATGAAVYVSNGSSSSSSTTVVAKPLPPPLATTAPSTEPGGFKIRFKMGATSTSQPPPSLPHSATPSPSTFATSTSTSTIPSRARRASSTSLAEPEDRPHKKMKPILPVAPSLPSSSSTAPLVVLPAAIPGIKRANSSTSSSASRKRGRPRKPQTQEILAPDGTVIASFHKGGSPTKSHHKKVVPSTSSIPPLPTGSTSTTDGTSTPSRMSLRQVLAMSVREASASAPNSGDESSRPDASTFTKRREGDEVLSDVSVSDLDLGEDDDSEEDMEKAEEKALRKEYKRKKNGGVVSGATRLEEFLGGDSSDDLTELEDDSDEDVVKKGGGGGAGEEDSDDSEEEDSEAGAEWDAHAKEQERIRGELMLDETTFDEDLVDEDDPDLAITELPPTGGRGVITWSDYDSMDDGDDFGFLEDDGEVDLAGDFEKELEELLAISEAVVGPVRDEEYEFGEMWFEEISEDEEDDEEDDGDDESGSAADDESEEDEDGEHEGGALLFIDGRWTAAGFQGSLSGSSEGDSDEDDDEDDDDEMETDTEDDGDTTDSIDSDDRVGLVRFGIEVEDEATDSECSETDYYRHAPGTASLADVQAPTSADLASLPQYLLAGPNGEGMMIDLQSLEDVPELALRHVAKEFGMEHELEEDRRNQIALPPPPPPPPAPTSTDLKKSLLKGKGKMVDILEEDESAAASGTDTERATPAMGVFGSNRAGRSTAVVVIDGSDNFAPSPYSTVKKNKRRRRELLTEGTPSRRVRADSKVSTTSVTDGSISGEAAPEVASPILPTATTLDFDFDNVLNESALEDDTTPSGSSSDSDTEVADGLRKTHGSATKSALSDLARWSRIPIGAFRSSTMPVRAAQPFPTAVDPTRNGGTSGSSKKSNMTHGLFLPVGAVASLNNTLSSPGVHNMSTNRRAIERRMLTSPVMGPVHGGRSSLHLHGPPTAMTMNKKSVGGSSKMMASAMSSADTNTTGSTSDGGPRSKKAKRNARKAKDELLNGRSGPSSTPSTAAARRTSPSSTTKSNGKRSRSNSTALRVPNISPFVALPPGLPSDAVTHPLHSPLFRSVVDHRSSNSSIPLLSLD